PAPTDQPINTGALPRKSSKGRDMLISIGAPLLCVLLPVFFCLPADDILPASLLAIGLLALIAAFIAGLVWLLNRKQRALARQLGPEEVQIQPGQLRPGEAFDYRIRFHPTEPLH